MRIERLWHHIRIQLYPHRFHAKQQLKNQNIYIYKWKKKKWNVTLHQKLEGKKSSWFKRRNTLESAVNKCKIHLIIISWCEAGIIKHLHVWKIHNAALHLSAATSSLWLYLLASTKVASVYQVLPWQACRDIVSLLE